MAHIKQPGKIKNTYSVYNGLKTKIGKTISRLIFPPVNNEKISVKRNEQLEKLKHRRIVSRC